jgi:hypothetical protein
MILMGFFVILISGSKPQDVADFCGSRVVVGPAERTRLTEVLVDDLEVWHAPVEVSFIGNGREKLSCWSCESRTANFTGLAIFRRANGRDVEVRPNWSLLTDTKGKRPCHRLIPMNTPVREALLGVIQNRKMGLVFDTDHTGVGR